MSITKFYLSVSVFSCKEPVEPLTLEEVAERCHAPEDVHILAHSITFLNYAY